MFWNNTKKGNLHIHMNSVDFLINTKVQIIINHLLVEYFELLPKKRSINAFEFVVYIWEEDAMFDNALENSNTTSFCVFGIFIIASFKYRKLSNKSTSITLTLIKIQNIHWAHMFTCEPILPKCQPRFWCFYICLHKFGIVPSRRKKIEHCVYIIKFWKLCCKKGIVLQHKYYDPKRNVHTNKHTPTF